jgi:hypothetical protein
MGAAELQAQPLLVARGAFLLEVWTASAIACESGNA